MKILIVNTYDYGGASSACKRLHLGLLDLDVDSKILLRNSQKDWPKSYQFKSLENRPTFQQKLKRKIRILAQELKLYKKKAVVDQKEDFINNRPEGLEMFSYPHSNVDITQSPLYLEADIINLHWVANFLDFKSFFEKNKKPVVWTLHDMNPFTGGEHYLEEYLGIDESGRPIKRFITQKEKKISEVNLKLKKEALNRIKNLYIVAPSIWLLEEAKKSEILNTFPIHHIRNGLDPEIFKILDKDFAKSLLNIPREKKVILFVADSIDNHRKGFIYLKKVFEFLSNRDDLILCAIGSTIDGLEKNNAIINLGKINDDRLMSAAYNAADVFVIPSLMDNLPNTVLESLMCGTPVIGFPVGGIPEMIDDRNNGILTSDISVSSLKNSLEDFLRDGVFLQRQEIRDRALEKYDQGKQAKTYSSLFLDILENAK